MIESIAFVIPSYRTAATLPELIDRIEGSASTFAKRFSVIVVDDACPERSGETVVGRENVDVYHFDTNQGQRTAVLAGLSKVTASHACVLDADLQDDPTTVPQLVAALSQSGKDVVCAGRAGSYQSRWRRSEAWAFRRLRWVASRGRIPPDAGLFHVSRSPAVRAMLALARAGDDPLVAYVRSGAGIASVRVLRSSRESGSSSYSWTNRLKMASGSFSGLVGGASTGAPIPVPNRLEPTEST